MSHVCSTLCRQIVAEQSGNGQAIHWNSLSHEEQAAWLVEEHDWSIMKYLHRTIRAAKVLFGAAD